MLNSLLVVWLLCFKLGENYVVLINILYVPVFDGKYIPNPVYHRGTTANTIINNGEVPWHLFLNQAIISGFQK